MRVVRGNAVKELPERLVALRPVAGSGASRRLDARGDVLRAGLLTRLVDVARLGGVQATVHRRHFGLCEERKEKGKACLGGVCFVASVVRQIKSRAGLPTILRPSLSLESVSACLLPQSSACSNEMNRESIN